MIATNSTTMGILEGIPAWAQQGWTTPDTCGLIDL